MVRKDLATVVVAALAISLAFWRPAVAIRQDCSAIASFSGHSTEILLSLSMSGKPIKESIVEYKPAGGRDDIWVAIQYPMTVDRMPELAPPIYVIAHARVRPGQESGIFVLTFGGQKSRSTGTGTVLLEYRHEWGGKNEIGHQLELTKPLLDALATGGPGQLTWFDPNGVAIAHAELSFASKAAIQSAVDQSYPTALAYATHKAKC